MLATLKNGLHKNSLVPFFLCRHKLKQNLIFCLRRILLAVLFSNFFWSHQSRPFYFISVTKNTSDEWRRQSTYPPPLPLLLSQTSRSLYRHHHVDILGHIIHHLPSLLVSPPDDLTDAEKKLCAGADPYFHRHVEIETNQSRRGGGFWVNSLVHP